MVFFILFTIYIATSIIFYLKNINISLSFILFCLCPILNTWNYQETKFKDIFKRLRKEKMTKEKKKLLILDLSSRLSYGVYIQHPDFDEPQILDTIFNYNAYEGGLIQVASDDIGNKGHSLIDCRPYLRRLSSMTKEEKEEYDEFEFIYAGFFGFAKESCDLIDWLNKHHFDYRGLIDLGLAIEAKKGMYDVN